MPPKKALPHPLPQHPLAHTAGGIANPKNVDPAHLHILYLQVLDQLTEIISGLSGVPTSQLPADTQLSSIPNLVIEPTLLGRINGRFFPHGGGFQMGEIDSSWTIGYLARVIVYKMTGA